MSKILIIEDNTDINNIIASSLQEACYEYQQVFSGTEALLYIQKYVYDVIILDLMLPGLSGNSLIKEIRQRGNTPIIVVSAKDELQSKVNVLMSGADDYITKPFELEELLARIAVQIRKHSSKINNEILSFKQLTLNRQNHEITINGHLLTLTRQEYKILELLLSYPSKVFSKQEIYDYAWNEMYIGEDKTINVHISHIRQKIKSFTKDEYIETVWGIGFKLTK